MRETLESDHRPLLCSSKHPQLTGSHTLASIACARTAAKMAFMPPAPTYKFVLTAAGDRLEMHRRDTYVAPPAAFELFAPQVSGRATERGEDEQGYAE